MLFHLDAARLDLREVEDVVDDREQALAAAADRVDAGALVPGERRLQQERGHPDHPVHRGADLVAHVGEELGLRAGGLLEAGIERDQLRVAGGQLLLALAERLERLVALPTADAGTGVVLHARDQLDLVGQLDEVVARPELEREGLAARVLLGGDHDHRDPAQDLVLPVAPEQLKAVDLRHQQVLQDDGGAEPPGLGERLPRILAVMEHQVREVGERRADGGSDQRLVIDQQDLGRMAEGRARRHRVPLGEPAPDGNAGPAARLRRRPRDPAAGGQRRLPR